LVSKYSSKLLPNSLKALPPIESQKLHKLVGARSTNGSYTSRDELMQGDNSDNRTNRSFQNKRKIQLGTG